MATASVRGACIHSFRDLRRKGTYDRPSKETASRCGECTGRPHWERKRLLHRRAKYGNFFMNSSKVTSLSAD